MSDNPKIGSYEYFEQLHAIEEKHWWSRGMRDIAQRMLERQYGMRTGLDILDAGCGTGISLSWLKQYSQPKEVVGIDVSQHALDFSKKRGHNNLYKGSVMDLHFKDASFDLIVCNDVIQHLSDDVQALKEFLRVLRPGGCLMVRTNSKQGISNNKPNASEDYRMYTVAELQEKTREAGFRMLQITHVNMLMSIVPIVKRYFRERKENRYDDRGLPIRLLPPHLSWANELLHGLIRIEAKYLSRPSRALPFGNSIIFLAQKPEAN